MRETTFCDYLRAWKRYKMSDGEAMGWPSITPLGKAIKWGTVIRGSGASTPDLRDTSDEELFDGLVAMLRRDRPGLFPFFVAAHLGILAGDLVRNRPHRARAMNLGVSPSTYWRRVRRSEEWLSRQLSRIVDI